MTFQELRRELVANLRDRVRTGQATERGLARVTGVSQPHIHHVLKGKRLLSLEAADRILDGLQMDVLDLVEPAAPPPHPRRTIEDPDPSVACGSRFLLTGGPLCAEMSY